MKPQSSAALSCRNPLPPALDEIMKLKLEPPLTLCAIAAMADNRVIGNDNDMPWNIPGELKRFKERTMGKPIIMGRRTHESLGRALPGRMNIVISSAGAPLEEEEDIYWVTSLEEAIEIAAEEAEDKGVDEIFIIGGAQVYEQALPQVQRLYLTTIHHSYDGDKFFPKIDLSQWREVVREDVESDPPYSVLTLERK